MCTTYYKQCSLMLKISITMLDVPSPYNIVFYLITKCYIPINILYKYYRHIIQKLYKEKKICYVSYEIYTIYVFIWIKKNELKKKSNNSITKNCSEFI